MLARECGLSAARISQLAQGSGGLKAENLFQFARATGFSPHWLAEGVEPRLEGQEASQYASIPQYTAKGAAGRGHANDHVEVRGGLMFKREWLIKMGLKEENLKAFYNTGLSMYPTLAEEDILLLDESQRHPLNGKIYAIRRQNGEISIKRLVHTMTNGWIIRSDNSDKRHYPDELASEHEIEGLEIIGRIVWHGGIL